MIRNRICKSKNKVHFSGLCKIELAPILRTNSIMVGFAYILDSNFLEYTFADLGLCKISHIFPL